MSSQPGFYEQVWDFVKRVPTGRVVAYGQVASWLGRPRAARAVGYAMFNVPNDEIPWHRVVNSRGFVSHGGHLYRPELQRERLAAEGVEFDATGRIEFQRFGWHPCTSVLSRLHDGLGFHSTMS